MKRMFATLLVLAGSVAALVATAPPDFSGKWTFDPGQSKNVGMMAQGKITTVIHQSKSQFDIADSSVFGGQAMEQHTVYDLDGKAVSNTSMMAGQATTHSHWEKNRLVSEWESPGAIAGSTVKRIETRYLSPDGKTMYVESGRPGKQTIVMVFTKSS
ncbi:MAG: hypothetical protein ABI383_15105 [Acidobacteriaceae bacterium]